MNAENRRSPAITVWKRQRPRLNPLTDRQMALILIYGNYSLSLTNLFWLVEIIRNVFVLLIKTHVAYLISFHKHFCIIDSIGNSTAFLSILCIAVFSCDQEGFFMPGEHPISLALSASPSLWCSMLGKQ